MMSKNLGEPVDEFVARRKREQLSREVIGAARAFDDIVKAAREAGLTVEITIDEINQLPNVSVL